MAISLIVLLILIFVVAPIIVSIVIFYPSPSPPGPSPTPPVPSPSNPCKDVTCPVGQQCLNGKCVPVGPPLNPCINEVCPKGFQCVNGKCIPINPPPPPPPPPPPSPPPPSPPTPSPPTPSPPPSPPTPPILQNVILQNVYDMKNNNPSYVSFRQVNNNATNSNPNNFSCSLINLSTINPLPNTPIYDQNVWTINFNSVPDAYGGYLVNKLNMNNTGWGFGNNVPLVCTIGGFGVPAGCLITCICNSFSNFTQSCVNVQPPATGDPLYLQINNDRTISFYIYSLDGQTKNYLLFNKDSYGLNPLLSTSFSSDNTDKNKLLINQF